MTPAPGRRERQRQATLDEIVDSARAILAEDGELSLRAVAQRMGMTAPALYRYVASYQDLLRVVAIGIDAAMTAEHLQPAVAAHPADDPAMRITAAALAFRRWALASRKEFDVVFTNMDVASLCIDPTLSETTLAEASASGALFNDLLVQIWQKYDSPYPALADLDDDLVEILRDPIMPVTPIEIPDDLRGLLWVFTRSWSALYGTVTLEVFGHVDPRMTTTGVLFRQMFRDQARVLGLADELPRLEPFIVAELAR
ncbi:helix-turn-helix transcriptional regulator [Nocardioides sp. JQ2195]|uniref:TetR/AcrR family transcriptional regulator n=1 Tax=Nocardioides sp. JQ2195 TaxID=2592334 RepID=UPI00143E6DEE|nr:WHG domain-containing protein [Nocardioides sp. JQ2195]QIX25281.1 helix-turn-helix transcriptional regulator [Nocardioides sp. JQ2195]